MFSSAVVHYTKRKNDRRTDDGSLDETDLQDCPCCGSVGSIEEEGGWCLYVQCVYCGARTAELSYKNEAERQDAARRVAINWNLRKVISPGPGE